MDWTFKLQYWAPYSILAQNTAVFSYNLILFLRLRIIAKLYNYFYQSICSSMASASCLVAQLPFTATLKPRVYAAISSNRKAYLIHDIFRKNTTDKLHSAKAKAAGNNGSTKPNSVICADCDGNGAVQCSQCKGSGVNSADLFNGQFKAGDSCWLCGGKKHMLCGNCNGAGFIGGFMSTFDE
ncbi:Chaperone protein DnaJ-like [Melia azedarach]|uniref:Chaperone protein DnaJ-like n=1 Tax=Melia azedarach TaxID=155640 RepID=A0ACC1X972_MELAZ|nr:Chaperone protein DnaJ-like [Melia azedarach]